MQGLLGISSSLLSTRCIRYMAVPLAENGIQPKLELLIEIFVPQVRYLSVAEVSQYYETAHPPADDLKHLIANSASWVATTTKNAQNSKRLSDSAKVAGTLGDLSLILTTATTKFMKQVLWGDDNSVKYLGDRIAEGKFNKKNTTVSMPELQTQIVKVLLAILIPATWRVSDDPKRMTSERLASFRSQHVRQRRLGEDGSTLAACLQLTKRSFSMH
ncbi:uncharacterized protein NECHADRAFT_81462 [Fusarium vanettenii 77-13-4]|uniref:Uncharacterized protein n=1 Tax=Fusarium vanettenii (strain ATCC MYA-4622 / CBS 123669 / FGSC 9596 / NRRL 45880 / 77-13-4) TaxID=660122 RepID=C7Z941_FUSV7|nr:uncharacterized protein NECHADRAFT_81462 [Fusarium vanettenii 77-13-4]EEU39354.1 predicted protein [Fusarium vanettenii 77-13-4]